jgi:hypothetical protein
LKDSNPAAADKLLSHILQQKTEMHIRLRDADTGEALGDTDTVHCLADDFFNRPLHAKPSCDAYREHVQHLVAHIRSSGASPDVEGAEQRGSVRMDAPFTMEELNEVVRSLNPTKQAFRGAYAAIKASGTGGLRLTLILANMSFLWGVSATALSQRQCSPLHKSGPRTVTTAKCLRPVSQGCDLSAVLDGLVILRIGGVLRDYWGPDQYGGCYEAQAPVLAVVILSELRAGAGLDLILNFMDQVHGYDVVPKDDIRLGLFRAGVTGKLWLLLDDQLRHDHVRLAIDALKSAWVSP